MVVQIRKDVPAWRENVPVFEFSWGLLQAFPVFLQQWALHIIDFRCTRKTKTSGLKHEVIVEEI